MRSADFKQIVEPRAYADGGKVPPPRRDTGPADYDATISGESRRGAIVPPPPQRDDPLNADLNRGSLSAKEYAKTKPKREPELKAKGGKIHHAIHHHIAHALIKLAEGGDFDAFKEVET